MPLEGTFKKNNPPGLRILNISKYVSQKNSICSKVEIETTTSILLSDNGILYGSFKSKSTFGPFTISKPVYLNLVSTDDLRILDLSSL